MLLHRNSAREENFLSQTPPSNRRTYFCHDRVFLSHLSRHIPDPRVVTVTELATPPLPSSNLCQTVACCTLSYSANSQLRDLHKLLVSRLVSLLLNYREIRAHRESTQSDRLAWVSSRGPTAGTQIGSRCSQLRQWQAVHLAAYLPVPFCHNSSSETTLREAVSPTVLTTREYIFLQPH